jgi:REP element-mobilizing transposase RayT
MASTLTNLLYHIVFSTKHRAPLIQPAMRDRLHSYMGGIIRSEGGVLIEAGGMPDHIHLLARLKPEPSVSNILKVVKSKSSKWVNDERLLPGRFQWQTGYGAFTVSVSQLPTVKKYIQNQESHHSSKTFQNEFRALLKRHEIEYDERYVWD